MTIAIRPPQERVVLLVVDEIICLLEWFPIGVVPFLPPSSKVTFMSE